MEYFFSKPFNVYNLSNCDYHKCPNGGFACSKTHYDLSTSELSKLNLNFHTASNNREDNPYNRNQRYFNQTLMISIFNRRLVERR